MIFLRFVRRIAIYITLFVYMSIVLLYNNKTLETVSIVFLFILSSSSYINVLSSLKNKLFLYAILPIFTISVSLSLGFINADGAVSLQTFVYKLTMLLVGFVLPSIIYGSNISIFFISLILFCSILASNQLQSTLIGVRATRLVSSDTRNIWEYSSIQMSLIILNVSTLFWRAKLKFQSFYKNKFGIVESPFLLLMFNFLIFLFYISVQLKTTTRGSVLSLAIIIILFSISLYVNNKRLNKIHSLKFSPNGRKNIKLLIGCILGITLLVLSWSSINTFFDSVLYNFSNRGGFGDMEGTVDERYTAFYSTLDIISAHPLSMVLFGVHSINSTNFYIDSGFLRMLLASGILVTSVFLLSIFQWIVSTNSSLVNTINHLACLTDVDVLRTAQLLPLLVAISSSSYLTALVFVFFHSSGYSGPWFFAIGAILGSYYIPANCHSAAKLN